MEPGTERQESATDWVSQAIFEGIRHGTLVPRRHPPEPALTRHLNIGRGSLHKALKHLAAILNGSVNQIIITALLYLRPHNFAKATESILNRTMSVFRPPEARKQTKSMRASRSSCNDSSGCGDNTEVCRIDEEARCLNSPHGIASA